MHTFAEIAQFLADYATLMMGSGVHTSRVIRCTKRIGDAWGVDVKIAGFHKTLVLTFYNHSTSEKTSMVAEIVAHPADFRLNSELSELSWQALDYHLTFDEVKSRYDVISSRKRLNGSVVMFLHALANACFCALFGGNWTARGIVFVVSVVGVLLKRFLIDRGVTSYIYFILCSFVSSMLAASSLIIPDADPQIAIATSVLYLIPGVPLLNGFLDIVEDHVLNGFSRLTQALLLVLCIAIGLACTISITNVFNLM